VNNGGHPGDVSFAKRMTEDMDLSTGHVLVPSVTHAACPHLRDQGYGAGHRHRVRRPDLRQLRPAELLDAKLGLFGFASLALEGKRE